MADTPNRDGGTTAKFQVLIDGRLEDVWHEITRTDDVQAAFFNGLLVAPSFAPGATVGMTTKSGAWITKTLKSVVETGRPSFGVRLLYGLFQVLEPISPKRCKSEHWPLGTLGKKPD